MGLLCRASALLALAHLARGDYLVPTYPAPVDLTSNHSSVAASWRTITSALDRYVANKTLNGTDSIFAGTGNITFSIGLFSLHDSEASQLQYHHESPETKAAENGGTNKVDADSIYRVASVSKLITVLAGMTSLSNEDWNRPLSEVMPGFINDQNQKREATDPIRSVQWDKVTLWSLAAQLSGIPTVGVPIGDSYIPGLEKAFGGPVEDVAATSPCAARLLVDPLDGYCSADETVTTIVDQPPNFLPWSTPAYSDLNFMLLGVAIANITGQSISDMYRSTVFDPLGMDSSMDTHPTDKADVDRSVIVGAPESGFAIETAITTPSGGILSTLCDLQKLGLGIMGNKLISAEATRKWMNQISHTASLSVSIGAPWEIYRYVSPTTNKTTDIYTKLGDSGFYGSAVALIPEYDAGFSMLNAGTDVLRSTDAMLLLDHVTNNLLPALEAQAAKEAKKNFVGTYKASSDSDVDASIKISLGPQAPGGVHSELIVSEWTYNGTDVLKGLMFKDLGNPPLYLEQSIPNQAGPGEAGEVAFQLSFGSQTLTYMQAMEIPDLGVIGPWTAFYSANGDFVFTDKKRWAGFPVQTLAFKVDKHGKATACSPLADRIELTRV